jgi:uncharacterized cupin superfamily protein
MAAFTIVHRDDLERAGKWALVRRSLGVESFGVNLIELQPGESSPEHDGLLRDQEEIFLVLDGAPTLFIDGESHSLTAGTFVRLDPEPVRIAVNEGSEPASLLVVSAPRSSGYETMDWC